MFNHYLLTRYNVGLYSSNPYKIKDPAEWMAHRLDLFKSCAMSVARQSCKDFEWFIFIDPKTPENEIIEIGRVLTEAAKAGLKRSTLAKEMAINPPTDGKKWIITTRMDCDDRIAVGFIEIVQAEFIQRDEVIDVKGVQLDLKSGKFCETDRIKPNSPFISLIEKVDGMRTVFHQTHSTMYQTHGGRFVNSDEPYYYQVIHKKNIMNKLTGRWL